MEPLSLSSKDEAISDYDRMVRNNVINLHTEFKDIFGNIEESANKLAKSILCSSGKNSQNLKPVKEVSKSSATPDVEQYIRRSERIKDETKKVVYDEQCSSDENSSDEKKKRRRHGLFRVKLLNDSDFIDSDEELEFVKSKKRRGTKRKRSTNYKSGSTCHQCRQKSMEQKSCCRNEECRGMRGAFCNRCLSNRYGETVSEVLLDPKWICPPCRGLCNCSICRTKNGQTPTGIMKHKAVKKGFRSVFHFLDSIEGNNNSK